MTPKNLRLLADCLERNFMTDADRLGWASDLRGFAKDIERSALCEEPLQLIWAKPKNWDRRKLDWAKRKLEHDAYPS